MDEVRQDEIDAYIAFVYYRFLGVYTRISDKFKNQLLAFYPESLIEHIKSGEEVDGFQTTDKSVFELELSTGFIYFKDTVRYIRRLYVPDKE